MNNDTVSTLSQYIQDNPLAVLSTIDSDGNPHGTTLYVGSDANLNVYFLTKSQTPKYEFMRNHPTIALTFSAEDHQTTLQLTGTVSEVTAPDQGAQAFQVISTIRHKTQDFRLPISRFEAGPYVILKVTVERAALTEYESTNRIDGTSKIEYTA